MIRSIFKMCLNVQKASNVRFIFRKSLMNINVSLSRLLQSPIKIKVFDIEMMNTLHTGSVSRA